MYEKAQELGLPVMVHTGPEPKPLYSRHCQPVYVDDVAADFPDLTIILAHAGMGHGGRRQRESPRSAPMSTWSFRVGSPWPGCGPWSFIQPCGR